MSKNSEPDVLDSQRIEELGEEDKDLLIELLQMYLDVAADTVSSVMQAWNQQDREALERNAHQCKGMNRNLGAESLASLCEQIEIHALNAPETTLNDLVAQIPELFQQTQSAFGKLLQYLEE